MPSSLIHDPSFSADPAGFYERMLNLPAVFFNEADGCYFMTRHADVKELIGNHEVYDPRQGSLQRHDLDGPFDFDPIVLQSPPEHTRMRRLAAHAFSMAQVSRFSAGAREIASRLAMELRGERGRFDLISQFTEPLALEAVARLIDLPDEMRSAVMGPLRYLIQQEGADPEFIQRQVTDFNAAIARHFLHVRDRGASGFADDLVNARVGGDVFSQGEAYGMLLMAVIGGAEDMVRGLANIVYALWLYPQARAAFRADPASGLNGVVSEALRLFPTTQYLRRVARRSIAVQGVEIPQGASVVGLLGVANRDPAVFDEAGAFRIDRRNVSASLTFGSGPHVCVGKHIGRIILNAGLMALMEQLPDLELDPAASQRTLNPPILGFRNLWAEFGPRPETATERMTAFATRA